MKLSYWEYQTWLADTDFAVVGSGIVGLSCALHLRSYYPGAKIVVLEKGSLPSGASTKNAGFACFGSVSEILSDLETLTEDEVISLVTKRWQGIQLLRKLVADRDMDYQNLGGNEIFLDDDEELFERCMEKLDALNHLLQSVFPGPAFSRKKMNFKFSGVQENYIHQQFEGQLNPGLMMHKLMQRAQREGITILTGVEVKEFSSHKKGVELNTGDFSFTVSGLFIATNGFAKRLLDVDLKPARAQVVLTSPIEGLDLKGTFHFQEGYYYFRNVDDRILLGGGRNLDFEGESTEQFGENETIRKHLEHLLKTVILPGKDFKIAQQWSGIMGVGKSKQPIIQECDSGVYCGVRLGGMGIALGSLVGKELATMAK